MNETTTAHALGDERDENRCVAVSVASGILWAVVIVSLWLAGRGDAMAPYEDAPNAGLTIGILTSSVVMGLLGGFGAWPGLLIFSKAVGAFSKGKGLPRTRQGNGKVFDQEWKLQPSPRFLVLVGSVVLLAISMIVLVHDSGGVGKSPFLQFFLCYFVCGVILADRKPTKVAALAFSALMPLVLWFFEDRGALVPYVSGQAEFSLGDVAVITAIATLIAGVVNLIDESDEDDEAELRSNPAGPPTPSA